MPRNRGVSLSVVVICRNEADRIGDCLASVKGWADEIVVLDAGSTDGTTDIARRYADCLRSTDWPGFSVQRNRGLALATGDWVFMVDADERVTPELREEIDEVLALRGDELTLLKMRWRTYFLGKPLRFGRFTSPQARLFRRIGARYPLARVHEGVDLPLRRAAVLKHCLEHHSWRSYRHAQEKHLHYACLLAEQKHDQGRRSGLPFAVLRFIWDFTVQYLLRLSVLDGGRGLLISLVLAQYGFHKYAALWSLRQTAPARPREVPLAPSSAGRLS